MTTHLTPTAARRMNRGRGRGSRTLSPPNATRYPQTPRARPVAWHGKSICPESCTSRPRGGLLSSWSSWQLHWQ